jgi:hypothetical protein
VVAAVEVVVRVTAVLVPLVALVVFYFIINIQTKGEINA